MVLTDLFKKQTESPTPLLVKIGVIFGLWLVAGPVLVAFRAMDKWNVGIALDLLPVVIHAGALIAIWNLRRWGVLVFLVVVLLSVFFAAQLAPSAPIIVAVVVVRSIVLVPALAYWKRMTW